MIHRTVSETALRMVSELVACRMGLDFPPERWQTLQRGLTAAAAEFGLPNAAACADWVLSSPLSGPDLDLLASHLTVGETYFFRDRKLFDALEHSILPELIHERRATTRRLRIWSAACCTGEESYSLAIVLRRLLPDLPDWSVTILATDINRRYLGKASAGVYGEWSFRETPPGFREKYFRCIAQGQYELLEAYKEMVTYSYLNLSQDVYPSLCNNTNAMDVILCRNVLMYFTPDMARQAAEKLHDALLDGGWLAVSPSEASHILFSNFAPVHRSGTMLYHKESVPANENGHRDESPWQALAFPVATSVTGPDAEKPPADDSIPAGPTPVLPEEALCETAVALYAQRRLDEAAEAAAASVAEAPNETAMLLLARIHANRGELEVAFDWSSRAIELDKLNPSCYYLHAVIQLECGQAADATASLWRAIYADPDFVLAHFALGDLARRQGDIAAWRKHWQNALHLLEGLESDCVLPDSDGMMAGRLAEITRSALYQETSV